MLKNEKDFKKVFMFVNVDWFFLSHRLPIAKAAYQNNFEMSVFADLTNKADSSIKSTFNLFQSPLSRSIKNSGLVILEFIKVFILIVKKKPDLIHAVTIKPIILLGIVSRFTKTPFIAAISGLGPVFTSKDLFSKIRLKIVLQIYRFIFKPNSAVIICQSSHDKNILLNFKVTDDSKITLAPGSGVNLEKFKPIEFIRKKKSILMASRILAEKGILEYCFAAKQFISRGNENVEFILAGPIDEYSPSSISAKKIKSLCDDCSVNYLGDRRDLNILLASATIFVLPTYYAEGIPKVLLEAAACGTPVITTDHPGCRDALIDKVTGVLVEPRNVNAIEMAISKLLEDSHTLEKMGKAGRKFAEKNFNEEKVKEIHYQLYRHLTKKNSH